MPFDKFKEKLLFKDEAAASLEHDALLKAATNLVNISRDDMSKNFHMWDVHDEIFRSERKRDKEDRVAMAKGDPKKMIVPLTFSQIMTFVSFAILSITQNRRFYELEPVRRDEEVLEEVLELILEHDLRRNKWTSFLVQFFLDIGRFSLGAAEVCYQEEKRWIRVPKAETVPGAFGVPTETSTNDYEEVTIFVGNRIHPVSPYRFLPDTRLPLTRYQEGEFCGSEELWSMARLRGDGNLFNLDRIPKMTESAYRDRRKVSRIDLGPLNRQNPNLAYSGVAGDSSEFVQNGPVVVTKLVADIVPKQFKVGEENPLGKEDRTYRYIIWYANDKTIIRFDEATYLHCQFPYMCAQYTPDQHQTVNEGLSDLCDELTNLITWKLNAHVASQRNSVLSKFLIDPSAVDIKDFESRGPFMFLKKGAALTGVDRYVKQFITQDTTGNTMKDIADLKGLTENITGWSGQMQGQYSAGRRSATQDREVARGAGARGKIVVGAIWDCGFEPLGKQLIVNNRQDMELADFINVIGEREWPLNPKTQQLFTTEEVYALFKSDPLSLAKSEHFFVFDATLPSEKSFLAQSLQEILMVMFQNPEISVVLGYGPEQIKELFNQIYLLRGVTPARLPAPQPMMPQPGIVAMPPAGARAPQPGQASG